MLWWSKGGKLKGESSRRIAFLREIIESLPGPLTPAGNVVFQTAVLPEAEREAGITQLPKEMHRFLRTIAASIARMEVDDRTAHLAENTSGLLTPEKMPISGSMTGSASVNRHFFCLKRGIIVLN